MTDLTIPPAARRFAALLDREYCFWMPSPSVALLAALVTSKERPKRLLGPDDLPAFVVNVGRVAGAAPVSLAPSDIDDALGTFLGADGLTPGQIWGVAWHRDGKLTPTDWLARCAALKVPTIELCLGSLAPLAQWGSFPATFTIVDLDAEASFAGVRLTALLTSDRGLAARVQHLCLPGPEARDYILDANPRGLAQDEPDLLSIVEEAAAHFGGKRGAAAAPAGRASWWQRLRSAGSDPNAPSSEARGSAPLPKWSARFTEIESHHAELLRTATGFAESLKARLEQQTASAADWQRRCLEAESTASSQAATIQLWETRFNEAEAEAEKDAAILSRVRGESARQKTEFESTLASMQKEREALEQRLTRAEEEHTRALGNAADSELRTSTELRQRVKELEAQGAAAADREVKLAHAAESERERLEQKLARTEEESALALRNAAASELRVANELRDGIRALEEAIAASANRETVQNRAAESMRAGLQSALDSTKAEREALAQKLARTEAEQILALKKAAASELRIVTELGQRIKELEGAAVALTDREAKQAQAAASERAALEQKLARAEAEHVVALRSATSSEMRITIELRQRIKELEETAAALTDREAKQALAAESMRGELMTTVNRLEADLLASEEQKKALARKVADLDVELGEALAESARRSADQRGTLEEQSRRASKLEGEVATLAAREAENAALRGNLAEAAERERTLQAAVETQRRRAEELEQAAEALRSREAVKIAEGESSKAGLAERIRRLETDADLVQQAFARYRDEKKAVDRALAQARAEIQTASEKLAAAEAARDEALLDASRRGETLRAALEEQKQQLEESRRDSAVLNVRETRQAEAFAVERAEMAGRIKSLEAMAIEAREGHESARTEMAAMAGRLAEIEMARDLAVATAKRREDAHRGAVEELEHRADMVKREAAAAAEREARQAEAREASRAELVVRIARLEEAEVAAEKARTELFNRKLESDRALAAAQAEIAVLTRKPGTPPPSVAPGDGEKPVNTGGFSSLINVLQTSVVQRPPRRAPEEKPPQKEVNQPFEFEATPDGPSKSSAPPPGPATPAKTPEAPPEKSTGGFAALVSRLTGRTQRPSLEPPPSDESEKLGGWLRDLGGRKKGKD